MSDDVSRKYPLVQPCATVEEWRRLRGTYIGGSDAAAILGVSHPRHGRTAGEVWIEKVRAQEALEADPDAQATDPELPNRFTEWGVLWEPLLIRKYQQVTGYEVSTPGLTLYRHPNLPFLGGTLDGEAITPFKDKRIVEAKTTDAFVQAREQIWGESGTDDVPDWFLVQVMHYIIVRQHEGFAGGDFPVLIGGNDFRLFVIEYHRELAERMIEIETDFWQMVVERRIPALDYTHPRAADLQRRIWNKVNGSQITVPPTYRLTPTSPTIIDLFAEEMDARQAAAAAEARADAAKAQLMHIAGDNALVEIEGTGLGIRRSRRAGHHVDAYDVKPYTVTEFIPRTTKKRAELVAKAEAALIEGEMASLPPIEGEGVAETQDLIGALRESIAQAQARKDTNDGK